MASKASIAVAAGLAIAGGLAALFSQASRPEQKDAIPAAAVPLTALSQPDPPPPPAPATQAVKNTPDVLVCMDNYSWDQRSRMTPEDNKKADAYRDGMVNVAKTMIAQPESELKELFDANRAVVFEISRYFKSAAATPGYGPSPEKMTILPHEDVANQKCPPQSSPVKDSAGNALKIPVR